MGNKKSKCCPIESTTLRHTTEPNAPPQYEEVNTTDVLVEEPKEKEIPKYTSKPPWEIHLQYPQLFDNDETKYPPPYGECILANDKFLYCEPLSNKHLLFPNDHKRDRTLEILSRQDVKKSIYTWPFFQQITKLAEILFDGKDVTTLKVDLRKVTKEEWASCPYKAWWYNELLRFAAIQEILHAKQIKMPGLYIIPNEPIILTPDDQKLFEIMRVTEDDITKSMAMLQDPKIYPSRKVYNGWDGTGRSILDPNPKCIRT
jgi:hypothetical protein